MSLYLCSTLCGSQLDTCSKLFCSHKNSDLIQSIDNEWPFNGNYSSQCIIKTQIPAAENNLRNICLCLQTLSRSSGSNSGLWLQIQRKLLQFLPVSSPITELQEKHTGIFTVIMWIPSNGQQKLQGRFKDKTNCCQYWAVSF